LKIDKAKIGFRAIAVVAAINLQGRVVALLLREGSICTSDFVDFLRNLKSRMRGEKTYVFLDNLRIHHTLIIASKAQANNQVLIFNASYSSQLNPIERLWAIAKRQFVKDCVTDVDFKQQEEIKAFVKKNILEASPETLEKHVFACLKLMQNDLLKLR
jgi:transposase